ncbi:hypothetical protein Poly24_26370 [Rosistilla carotiformis]|uniref:DUF998 domain-containing protein n=1 Tax=Rosistilla carotiformis TaxID=2528017 RepID=A0A518JTP4_9BACT|nr:hypothetical protein [Rosistilla carotiformis]QDV68924.1 hypothetical protein Poly24_26370 [Rosistilla carotiformis]
MIPEYPDKTNVLVISYLTIRRAIGVTGLLLPLVLGPGGWIVGIPLQPNLSSYYHTGMRDVFVGTLSAIGIFLYCYRSYDRVENWTANLGCVSALGIAFFPLDFKSDPLLQKSLTGYLHSFCGGVFFLTLAFYSLYHFPRDAQREDEPHLRERRLIYRTSGIVILVSLVAMGAYLFVIRGATKQWLNEYHFLFWMEWIAVWAFAAAWLAKGRTIIADVAVDAMAYANELLLKRVRDPQQR